MSHSSPIVKKKDWQGKRATGTALQQDSQRELANKQLYIGTNGTIYRHDSDEGDHIILAPKGTPLADQSLIADTRDKRDKLNRIKSLIRMRDCIRDILDLQRRYSDADIAREGWQEPPWAGYQRRLRELYDSFVHAYGAINKFETRETGVADEKGQPITFRVYPNIKTFRKDPDAYRVASIERYNETTGDVQLDPVFEGRIVNADEATPHIEDEEQALEYCLSEKGGIEPAYLLELLGLDEPVEDLMHRLHRKNRVYFDPAQDAWVLAEDYLSGDVRAKLRQAADYAKQDSYYQGHVDALRAVQPVELGPDDIDVNLGQHWIPRETIVRFAQEVLGMDNVEICYVPETHKWFVSGAWRDRHKACYEMGTEFADGRRILESCLNATQISITNSKDSFGEEIDSDQETLLARDKQRRLHARFREWLWADPDRKDHLCRIYNDMFNAYVPRSYNGRHMRLPGASPAIELRDVQLNVAWRNIWHGNTLYEHATGAGKTYAAITAAQELKRHGTIKKPLFVVPNHMLNQFAKEYYKRYPGVHVMIAEADHFLKDGHRMTADDKIQHFIAHARDHDYDAIIMTEENYNRIKLSPQNTLAQKLSNLQRYKAGLHDGDSRVTDEYQRLYEKKCIEIVHFLGLDDEQFSSKEQSLNLYAHYLEPIEDEPVGAKVWQSHLDRLGQNDRLWFEDMGVDYLFVDEGHVYKNPAMMSRHPGFARQGSERANAHLAKIDYLRASNPDYYASIMTATPLSNSLVEAYIFQRYLHPQMLWDRGIYCFDAWLAMFGETREELELMPEGTDFRTVERISRFQNLPELMRMYRAFTDVVTEDMLDLDTPEMEGGAPQLITIDPAYQAFYDKLDELEKRARRVRNCVVSRSEDNMLKIMNEANNLCLHPGLVGVKIPENTWTKLDEIAERVGVQYEKGRDAIFYDNNGDAEEKTGDLQMIVCDLGVPEGSSNYSVYDELRDKLVEKGVPAERIRFVHDYETDRKKQELFEACDNGEVSVLIGTTQKVGTGTNVQKRLSALHLATLGWRPMDLIQAIGRIVRQGNQHNKVSVQCYAMADSPEAYRWQTNERKARLMNQLKKGDMSIREIDDDEYTEFFAAANSALSQNDLLSEREKIAKQFTKLEDAKVAHNHEKERAKYRLKRLKPQIEALKQDIAGDEKILQAMTAPDHDDGWLTIAGTAYDDRAQAGQALQSIVRYMRDQLRDKAKEARTPEIKKEIGAIAGFTMRLNGAVEVYDKPASNDNYDSTDNETATTREYKYSFSVVVDDGASSEHKLSLDHLKEGEAERYLKKAQEDNADTSKFSFNSAAEAEKYIQDTARQLITPLVDYYLELQTRLDDKYAKLQRLESDKESLEMLAKKAFPEQSRYDNLRKKLQRVDNKLGRKKHLNGGDGPAQAASPS